MTKFKIVVSCLTKLKKEDDSKINTKPTLFFVYQKKIPYPYQSLKLKTESFHKSVREKTISTQCVQDLVFSLVSFIA